MCQRKLAKHLVGIFVLLLFSSNANAAVWEQCWGNNVKWQSNPTFRLLPISFPVGSTYRNQLTAAGARIAAGMNRSISFQNDTNNTISSFNGVNEIGFITTSESWLGQERTKRRTWGCVNSSMARIQESDIRFNDSYSWTTQGYTSAWVPGTPNFSFSLVAIHELLHGVGLKHQNGRVAIMNEFYPNSGPVGNNEVATLHGDDYNGIKTLYGTPNRTDFSVSRQRNSGGGSTRDLEIRTPGTTTRIFQGARGSNVDIEYTFENLSSSTKNGVVVGFYISTNDFISTSDTFLGTVSWNMPSGSVANSTATVNLPTTLSPGRYHLGYVVDPWGSFSEFDESNNGVSIFSHRCSCNIAGTFLVQ